MIRFRILGCLLAAMMTAAFPAEAQLGGLINKLKGKTVQSTGQPVLFDNVILELTPSVHREHPRRQERREGAPDRAHPNSEPGTMTFKVPAVPSGTHTFTVTALYQPDHRIVAGSVTVQVP